MWLFVVGLFAGAAVGLFVASLLLSAREADRAWEAAMKKQREAWSRTLRRRS